MYQINQCRNLTALENQKRRKEGRNLTLEETTYIQAIEKQQQATQSNTYFPKRSLLTMSLDRPSERRNSGFKGFAMDHDNVDSENHVPTRKSVSTDTCGRFRYALQTKGRVVNQFDRQ